METLKTIDSSVLSLIILIFIHINAYNRSEKGFIQYKLFIALVRSNMLLIIIDILGWIFNGLSGQMNFIANDAFNLLLYVMAPLGPLLWVLYSNYQVFHDECRIKKVTRFISALFAINAAFSVISLYTGWFFNVDSSNVYHRGRYFLVHIIFCFAFYIYSLFFILLNRSRIEKKFYYSLLLFALPLVLGSTLQVFFYGVSFNWSGMMLSILIIYFNIQNRGLNTDYLTGVYNRRQLDSYVKDKIRNSTSEKSFSAILIDLNEFKQINDSFGHDIGDEALQASVKILKKCLRNNDFIARFGGDEFYIIMDINSREMLENTVQRINNSVEMYNIDNQKPYKIGFCMGYDIYDHKIELKSDDFFKHIDMLMYNNKSSCK